MKYLQLQILFFLLILTNSCSTDKDIQLNESKFELFVNGKLIATGADIEGNVFKTENTIEFKGFPNTLLSFNSSGQFGFFKLNSYTDVTTPIAKNFYSFRGFSSNYFNFNLESIDEINKKVKGTFSGFLYANPLDLNSEKKFVSGSFDIKYKDVIPGISNLGNSAKINGVQWTKSNTYYTRETSNFYQITQHDLNDGPYKIMIHYRSYDVTVGTYNFSSSDITFKVELAIFDSLYATFINYECNGILNITHVNGDLYVGNYNFTANHPITGEIITVTDGSFKFIHKNSN